MNDRMGAQDARPLREHIDDVWLAMRSEARKPRTIEDYREKWQAFALWLADHAEHRPALLADFTLDAARRYLADRLDGADGRRPLSAVSAAAHARVLKAISTRLHQDRKTGDNRLAPLRQPKSDDVEKEALTEDEVRSVLARLSGLTVSARRNAALFAVGVDVGPRISELLAANAEDVAFGPGWIRIDHPAKRGPQRRIPLGTTTTRYLRSYLGSRKTGPLFLDRSGGRLTDDAARNVLLRVALAVGLPRFGPHALRHTAASYYSQFLGDDTVKAKVFGWKPTSLDTMARYTHLTWEQVAEIHRRISPLDHIVSCRQERHRAA